MNETTVIRLRGLGQIPENINVQGQVRATGANAKPEGQSLTNCCLLALFFFLITQEY